MRFIYNSLQSQRQKPFMAPGPCPSPKPFVKKLMPELEVGHGAWGMGHGA